MTQPFHLAIPVDDLDKARAFYGDLLGFKQGRSDTQWIDWDMYGHQLVTHCVKRMPTPPEYNSVDGQGIKWICKEKLLHYSYESPNHIF